jgi:G3E family GTPase
MTPLIQNTSTHLITGFLGAGKTSFINACIANMQQGQKWAILVNEVGQIGIDEALYQD